MALDRFINNVRSEVAKRYGLKTDAEIDAFFTGIEECAKDNQEALEKRDKMLRDTVAELCEAKRLLKLATEDLNCANNCVVCTYVKDNNCPDDRENCGFKWRYTEEIEKLIGDE